MEDFCEGCKFTVQSETGEHFQNGIIVSAVQHGHEQCLKLLVTEGADVNAIGPFWQSALSEAIKNGQHKCVEILLKAGADINERRTGKPALIEAAKHGNDKCIDLLIASGADVNIRNKFGNTALIAALKSESDTCVNRLIQAGADVNASVSGITPLHIAADKGGVNVKALVQAGADVNRASYFETTALMFTVRNEDQDLSHYVDLLLDAGADVNARDKTGDSALFMASTAGNYNCMKRLLKAGAHINKINIEFGNSNGGNSRAVGKTLSCDMLKLLYAAGINGSDVNMLNRISELMDAAKITTQDLRQRTRQGMCLLSCCRLAIRQFLKDSNSTANLFIQMPKLGLPTILAEYLLFNISLD